jgi:hypothetical protein
MIALNSRIYLPHSLSGGKSKFKRQTENKYNQRRVEEINQEDQMYMQQMFQNNPELTMDEATQIYYDTKEYEMAKPTIQYERGNLLVDEEEYKNLTTYMGDLHDYYMAQAIEMEHMGFEVIIRKPLVFYYPDKEKHFVGYECLFQLYQRRSLDTQLLTLWTM